MSDRGSSFPNTAGGERAHPLSERVTRLAWLPIPVLLCSLFVLHLRPLGSDLGLLPLLPVFNFVFLALPGLLAAGLAARTYLIKGSPTILFVGTGTLAYAATALLASWPVPGGDFNTGSTTWYFGVALAGFFILLSAFSLQVPMGRRYSRPSLGIPVLSYSAVLVALTAICLAARHGLLPAFYVKQVGPTALRHTSLGIALTDFTAASLLVLLLERRNRSAFLHWYALGLALIVVGQLGSIGYAHYDSLACWVGRGCHYVGGIYLLVAVIAARRQSGNWLIPLATLHETYDRYTRLVDTCPDAILVLVEGQIVFANPTAARLFGVRSPVTLLQLPLLGLVDPDSRASAERLLGRSIPAGRAAPAREVRVLHEGGSAVDVELTAVPVTDEGRPAVEVVLRDITERKRAEEALRRAASFPDDNPCPILRIDKAGIVLYANPASSALAGDWRCEAGRPAPERFARLAHETLEDGKSRQVDVEAEDRVFSFLVVPIADSGYVNLYGLDITERKKFEDALRFLADCDRTALDQDFFQKLARYLARSLDMDFICIDRLEGDLLVARTVANYSDGQFGDNISYALKDTPCGAVVKEDRCCYPRDVRLLFPNDPVLQEMSAEGYVGTVLRSTEGRPIGLIALLSRKPVAHPELARSILQLVSGRAAAELERRQAEEALRASEASLAKAQAIAHLANWELDIGTNTVQGSRELYRIFELEPGMALDAYVEKFHPEDRQRVVDAIEAAIHHDKPYNIEYRIVPRPGVVRHIHAEGEVVRDDAGRAISFFGTVQDIAERKRAEETLREAKAVAEAASRAKDQFLAMLSHELRTPLTPIVMAGSLLADRRDLPEEVRGDLQMILQNVKMEARLIDDLLDLTRIARGKMQFNFQEVDAHQVIRAAVDLCGRGEGAPINVDLTAREHWVRADAARLQQVIWNLLNNARKFTPLSGTITVRSSDAPGGRLRIEVSDTGAGIDPAILPRLFNAFEQGDVDAQRRGGLGLGLAISRGIMDAHHGSIRIHSAGSGQGSTFTVELPVVSCQLPAESQAPAAATGNPKPATPLRILLVEDHESTRNTMRKLLMGLGHEVKAAECMEAAKAIAARDLFDLVISDLGLPDGSGHELMRHLKGEHGLRGIALSGYGMEADVRKSLEAGFAEHVIKPVHIDQLQAAVARVANGDGA